MTSIILYSDRLDAIVILEPNIGEYWANWKIVIKDYNHPRMPFDGTYYDGTLEALIDAGWEFIGDYK